MVGILYVYVCMHVFIVGLEMTKVNSLDFHVLPSDVKDPIKVREYADHWKCHLLEGCMKSRNYTSILS